MYLKIKSKKYKKEKEKLTGKPPKETNKPDKKGTWKGNFFATLAFVQFFMRLKFDVTFITLSL